MITQELIAYVRSELNKGKTREDIRQGLLSGGGWSEADISEVFRTVMPAPSVPSMSNPSASPPGGSINSNINGVPGGTREASPVFAMKKEPAPISISMRKEEEVKTPPNLHLKPILTAILIGGTLFVLFFFFKPVFMSLKNDTAGAFDALTDKIQDLFAKDPLDPVSVVDEPEIPVAPQEKPPVNCGTGMAPDRKNPSTYDGSAYRCLGENAIACNNAEGKINDPLFPTVFKITNKDDSCRFELSYAADTTLTDVFGKKLAFRSISCPISVVKSINEANPKNPVFEPANTANPNKYALDIYFYGTLGLFIDNNFSQAEIESLGCKGEFVKSVIESYNLMKSKS